MAMLETSEDYRDKIDEIRARRRGIVKPKFEGLCQSCGYAYQGPRELSRHWRASHEEDVDLLGEQLQVMTTQPFAPAPGVLLLELTIIFQEFIAYHRGQWQAVRKRLLEQIGLEVPFELRILGWTNRPQGAYRVYWNNQLYMQGVCLPWQDSDWEWLWMHFEIFIRTHAAMFRQH